MEVSTENSYSTNLNIENFSKMIGDKWGISQSIFKNYILANISIAMIRNPELKKNIDKIYLLDKITYYNAEKIHHVSITLLSLKVHLNKR